MTRELVFCCLIMVALTNGEHCFYKGKKYKTGFIFFSGCNACMCVKHRIITCNMKACETYGLVGNDDSQTCKINSKTYNEGDRFSVGRCKKCTCRKEGTIVCKHGSCKPKGCYYKRRYFKRGTSFRVGCVVCYCSRKGKKCFTRGCFFQH